MFRLCGIYKNIFSLCNRTKLREVVFKHSLHEKSTLLRTVTLKVEGLRNDA